MMRQRPSRSGGASLFQPDSPREWIDLSQPDSALYFGRSYSGEPWPNGVPQQVSYALRSRDRGRTWESTPGIIEPPPGHTHMRKDNHPVVRCPDGTYLGAFTVVSSPRMVALYGSNDDGATWDYLAQITSDRLERGFPSYPGLILLPSGRLQCYFLTIDGQRNAIQQTYSDDGGYTWSEPKPIVAWGHSPWVTLRDEATGRPSPAVSPKRGVFYRSPWPSAPARWAHRGAVRPA